MKKTLQKIEFSKHDEYIDAIAKEMWRIIYDNSKNPLVIAKAKSLIGQNSDATIRNVFNYVIARVPYKLDPEDREYLTAPKHLISGKQIGEDCDGMVMLICTLLLILGYKVRIKVIAWRKTEYSHVVAEVYDGKRWIELDATMPATGYDVKNRFTIRTKRYEMPTGYIETLNDNLSGGCGCGKKKATNENININPIIIGNELTNWLKGGNTYPQAQSAPFQQKVTERIIPQVIEKEVPVDRVQIVEKPIALTQSAYAIAKQKSEKNGKLLKAISTKKGTWVYAT